MEIAWFAITAVLLMWNAIYCARKVAVDFRGPIPASGVWGLFALAGTLSALAWGVIGTLVMASGI